MTSATRPIHELREEARLALSRGDVVRAKSTLFGALSNWTVREEEYVDVAREMRDLLLRTGERRAALTLDWYAGDERTQRGLLAEVPPIDRARTLLAWADRATNEGRRKQLHAQAADEYEQAGLVARAAIARERADDFLRARALWSRLSQMLSGGGEDLYAAALARFNLARSSIRTGERGAAREAFVGAVHDLEQAADRYETIGQRERAFDCFQVLLALGKESGEFEHVLEGSVNVIRILREDHLRYYALQSYEEAVAAAEKQGEKAAAATLAREMSIYARKEGLVAVANWGQLTQARLWQDVAISAQERGVPAEIAENALIAAIIAYGEAGQYAKVGGLYGALGALPLEELRRGHYARAASRYDGARDLAIDASPLPKHLRHEVGFPDVWHVDLVEWEQRGSASEACADVILDPSAWSEVTRRRAMLARLTALAYEAQIEAGAAGDPASVANLGVALADQLAQVELYSILSPLEHLFRRRETQVRAAVARALSRCLYKRSFITLREALADPEPAVHGEAARSLGELHFAHAFDPLARIYRESHDPAARAAALRALARVDTHEAAEFVLSVLEHDDDTSRAAAVDGLKRARGLKFLDLARGALPRLGGSAAGAVREVLQARGQAV